MGQLQQALQTIKDALGRMTASQQLLLGSLAVIAVMGLFLVSQYAGAPRWVELVADGDAANTQQTLAVLRQAGVDADSKDGRVVVPPSQQSAAVTALAQAGQLPSDTTILFQNLLEKQGMHLSRQQNEQVYLIALQNELARIIRGFGDVRDAAVLLDIPEPRGLGSSVRQPTASATIFTRSGREIDQGTVDAVAELISGARAGLSVDRVRVIDGSSGRQRRPTKKDDLVSTTYLEHAAKVEDQVRSKIDDLLSYIPGRTIAVTASVDVTRVRSETQRYLDPERGTVLLPASEESTSSEQGGASNGAQPGVRSNVRADLGSTSGDSGSTSKQETSSTDFESHVGHETQQIEDPRGMPTRLAASINIPRSYIASLIAPPAAADGADPAPIDDAAIATRFEAERELIRQSVLPHVQTVSATGVTPGEVVVTMVPVEIEIGRLAPAQAGLLGSITGGDVAGAGGMIDKIVLGGLAAVSLGLMVMMVRKAGKRDELPTPEEIIGIPPQLETPSDLIGEAGEEDSALAGIEVDDRDMAAAKKLQQVQDLLDQQPGTVASLLGRWVSSEEG